MTFDVQVFEDREHAGAWRVEYFDDDGGCYVTVFAGPEAERRARAYFDALKGESLEVICAQPRWHPRLRVIRSDD